MSGCASMIFSMYRRAWSPPFGRRWKSPAITIRSGEPPFSFHCGTSSAVVTVSTRLGSTCHAHMNKEKPIISIETEMIASLLRRG